MNEACEADDAGAVTLALAGDVMLGRGIDQILPHPSHPLLHERLARSANDYVYLAERRSGPIPRGVDFDYVWGDARYALAARRPAATIVNLETAITTADEPVRKGINYRMHPWNIGILGALGIRACVLANNHVLDWGVQGLSDTLHFLHATGIATAGAGADDRHAAAPCVVDAGSGRRIVVFAYGLPTSGIPAHWKARASHAGVNYLQALDADAVIRSMRVASGVKRRTDVVVVSLHWGANWGYQIAPEEQAFAHRLVDDAEADIVFGHSSHHAKGIEVYQGKLILYGAGDLINDYEGIGGHAAYRGDLALLYMPRILASNGRLLSLDLLPFRIRNFRLERASSDDASWLAHMLSREGERFGTRVDVTDQTALRLAFTA